MPALVGRSRALLGAAPWAIRSATTDIDFSRRRLASSGRPRPFDAFMAAGFSRGSVAADFLPDDAGVLTSFATNVPRLRGDGLLFEPSMVERIPNTTFAGATVGTPGTFPTGWIRQTVAGIAINVTDVGVENGMEYAEFHLIGTNTSGSYGYPSIIMMPNGTGGVAATQGTTLAVHMFAKRISGSQTGIDAVRAQWNEFSGAGSYLATTTPSGASALVIGTTRARYGGVGSVANASTGYNQPVWTMQVPAGNAVDFKFRLYRPSFRLLPYAASPIATTSGAVTQAQDVLRWTAAQVGAVASEGYIGLRLTPLGYDPAAATRVFSLEQGSATLSRVMTYLDTSGKLTAQVIDDSNTVVAQAVAAASSIGVDTTVLVAWGGGSANLKIGSGARVDDASAASPSAVTALSIGSRYDNAAPSFIRAKRLVVGARKFANTDEFDATFARLAA